MRSLPHQIILKRVSPVATLVALVLIGALAAWWMMTRTGLVDGVPKQADAMADWLVTRAFFDGVDPYLPVHELAVLYDVDYVSMIAPETPIVPRLPGAFLIQAPMVITDAVTASQWLIGLGVVATVLAVVLGSRVQLPPIVTVPAYLALGFISGIATWGFIFVTQSPLIAGLLAVVVVLSLRFKAGVVAGVVLGVVGTLKVFPLLLLIPFWARGRRRVVLRLSGLSFSSTRFPWCSAISPQLMLSKPSVTTLRPGLPRRATSRCHRGSFLRPVNGP